MHSSILLDASRVKIFQSLFKEWALHAVDCQLDVYKLNHRSKFGKVKVSSVYSFPRDAFSSNRKKRLHSRGIATKPSNVSVMFAVQVSKSGKTFNQQFHAYATISIPLFFRCFLRARGYIYLQKTPDVLCVWVLPSRHSGRSPQLDLILDWPRIHTCTRVSWSHNYSSHGELPTRRWCHSKCVVRYSSRCVRYHVFCVRICQLDGVCRCALCTNEISGIKHEWGMLDYL